MRKRVRLYGTCKLIISDKISYESIRGISFSSLVTFDLIELRYIRDIATMLHCNKLSEVPKGLMYRQTRLIRTLLIHQFRLIRRGNLKTLKVLSLTPMLNESFN